MKATRNYMMALGIISEDGSMDRIDLMDYAKSNLEKILSRVPGVGEVQVFGAEYSMRIWLDPDKLTNYHLTVEDVIMALRTPPSLSSITLRPRKNSALSPFGQTRMDPSSG